MKLHHIPIETDYPLLLDGGLSNELEKAGFDLNHKLWSALLLDSNPMAILDVHLAYLRAGAQCIISSSYQASIPGFIECGFDLASSELLILKTVELAELAIQQHIDSGYLGRKPLIAASIGPYGAYLSDGSEYTGNYGVSDREIYDFHLPRIQLLDQSNADFFACETIPSFQEAKVLASILQNTKLSAWISFSCKDAQHISDGTSIEECATLLSDYQNIFGIGVNCTPPKYISSLILAIKRSGTNKKIVVYPNSGEIFEPASKTWQKVTDLNVFSSNASKWLNQGADIIGGCCKIGPAHIKQLKDIVSKK